jgi:hypothetical protein
VQYLCHLLSTAILRFKYYLTVRVQCCSIFYKAQVCLFFQKVDQLFYGNCNKNVSFKFGARLCVTWFFWQTFQMNNSVIVNVWHFYHLPWTNSRKKTNVKTPQPSWSNHKHICLSRPKVASGRNFQEHGLCKCELELFYWRCFYF